MRNMGEHAEKLGWAAKWFNRFMWLSLIVLAIGIVAFVAVIFSGNEVFRVYSPSTLRPFMTANEMLQLLSSGIGGALLTAFLWRVGFIVCSFLADFASGLHAQQIQRERRISEVNKP